VPDEKEKRKTPAERRGVKPRATKRKIVIEEKMNRIKHIARAGLLALLLANCPVPNGDPVPNGEEQPEGPSAPQLLITQVKYDPAEGYALSVEFTFDVKVSGEAEGWTITGTGETTLTLKPEPETKLTSGEPAKIELTAKNAGAEDKTLRVPLTVMPVSGVLARRPAGDGPLACTVSYYDPENHAAGLRIGGGEKQPEGFLVEDEGLQKIFRAVYTPNAPESEDAAAKSAASTKLAVPFTETVSEAVLSLFKITVGADAGGDLIEIGGAELPPADPPRVTIIDIGIPEEGSSGPACFIRPQGLGSAGEDYAHIRLRVNAGASLVIQADNSKGEGEACPPGLLAGGTVEVMGGGELRNGAYRGFPLGKGSTIIVRLNSRFATGPEDTGWLVAPASEENAALCWGTGDQNGSYIEIRDKPPGTGDGGDSGDGTLAFDVNLTMRKSLPLRYHVWMVNGPALTIDVPEGPGIGGQRGLVAEDARYKIYGTYVKSGGQNPGSSPATITVKKGSAISRSALTAGEATGFITADPGGIAITNLHNKGNVAKTPYIPGSIVGYLNWNLP
jgi:hypothetical protein